MRQTVARCCGGQQVAEGEATSVPFSRPASVACLWLANCGPQCVACMHCCNLQHGRPCALAGRSLCVALSLGPLAVSRFVAFSAQPKPCLSLLSGCSPPLLNKLTPARDTPPVGTELQRIAARESDSPPNGVPARVCRCCFSDGAKLKQLSQAHSHWLLVGRLPPGCCSSSANDCLSLIICHHLSNPITSNQVNS